MLLDDIGRSIKGLLTVPIARNAGDNVELRAIRRHCFLKACRALNGGIDACHALDHGNLAAIGLVRNEPAGGAHAIVFLHIADVVLGTGNDGIIDIDDGHSGLFCGFHSRLQVRICLRRDKEDLVALGQHEIGRASCRERV